MFALIRFPVVLLAFAGLAAAQQDSSSDDVRAVLLGVRRTVLQTIERLPRYLCTETIDRSVMRPKDSLPDRSCDDLSGLRKHGDWKVSMASSDRLRLDVAVSREDEMYSWVGEGGFEDSSLADLVGTGATSTGEFVSFLGSIFNSNAASFTYNGDVHFDGRVLAEFSFEVPKEKSHFRIGNKLSGGTVPYHGVFWADPTTFELVRLSVDADRVPSGLNVCESATTLDYRQLELNGSNFLIPANVIWTVFKTDGSQFESHTVFSNCHEFRGESTLSFDDPSGVGGESAAQTAARQVDLPAGLPFALHLTKPIESATAAAGDPFRAELVRPIRGKHGVLVPKGAAVTGRILLLSKTYEGNSQSLTLELRLETIEVNGVREPFHATLDSSVRRYGKALDELVRRQRLGTFDEIERTDVPGTIEFRNVGAGYVVPPGFTLQGRTSAR